MASTENIPTFCKSCDMYGEYFNSGKPFCVKDVDFKKTAKNGLCKAAVQNGQPGTLSTIGFTPDLPKL